MSKSKKISDIIFIALICTVILAIGIMIILLPSKQFSQKENRPLSQAPIFSVERLLNGKYFEDLSLFAKDQFPFRDTLVSTRSICELSLFKTQVNGVLVTDDKALIALPKNESTEQISKNADRLLSLSKNRAVIYTPPRSIDVFSTFLPQPYDYEKETKIFSALPEHSRIFLENYLSDSDYSDYYKTDHHWTTDGAFRAYNHICESFGVKAFDENHFSKQAATHSFRGTSFSRSGLPEFMIAAENILLYRYSDDDKVSITNHETGETAKGFYDHSALETSDKYRIFLGGNYTHLSIKLNSTSEKPKLLLLKDSFANSLIPFLALHYDIEAIDPRYCTQSFLREHLQNEDYDKVLVLLSFDTLASIY